eukprot:gene16798-10616_t
MTCRAGAARRRAARRGVAASALRRDALPASAAVQPAPP